MEFVLFPAGLVPVLGDYRSFLPFTAASFCDAAGRKAAQEFFDPNAGQIAGAPRHLAQALQRVDLCIAKRAQQAASVAAFLKEY